MDYYDVNRLSIIAKYSITEDKNAVQNMLNIVKSIINTGKRPEIFCRTVIFKTSYPFHDG